MSCSVLGCSNSRRFKPEGISFHTFPRGDSLKMWLDVLGKNVETWTWSKNKVICSKHFCKEDYIVSAGKRILKPNAVPSVASGSQTIAYFEMHCAVVGCTTRNQNKTCKNEIFFPFPKDVNMCKAWKYACGRSDDFSTETAMICERHFEKSDYERTQEYDGVGYKIRHFLKTYALPTMNLSKLSGNVSDNIAVSDRTEVTDRTYYNRSITDSSVENVNQIKEPCNRKCAVSSCIAQNNFILDFPNPTKNRKTYLEWLSLCKNEELKKIPYEKLNSLYGICDAHFGKKTLTLHDSVPTLQLPELDGEVKEEIYEPSQLCRLCFNAGTIDVFSCRYYKKVLKDIIKTFVPIEIKKDDVSTLVCQSCKCEVIRFYNFLLKSLQVDEYFQAIAREVNNEHDIDYNNSVVVFEPNVSLVKVNEEEMPVASKEIETVLVDDHDHGDDDDVDDADGSIQPGMSLLRKCLTAGQQAEEPPKTIQTESKNAEEAIMVSDDDDEEEENRYLVPNYVMEYFHTYVTDPNKKRKSGRQRSIDKQISNASSEKLQNSCTDGEVVKSSSPNKKHGVRGPYKKRKSRSQNKVGADSLQVETTENNAENSDTIICVHCDKVIESIDQFTEHCKLENHTPLYACSVCNKMFDSQTDLDEHFEVHKKTEHCICDRCGKQFTKRDSLYSHMTFVHNKNDLKYSCNQCTKKFATNYRLKLHMRVHSNDRPYCCEKCGAVFTMLAYLRNHQTIHSDFKPHICLICNKGFRRRHKLAIHLTMHTGERKYSCEKCGISYKRKVNLTRHNRKYHINPNEEIEQRPRNCSQCDFVCNFPAQLKMHMLKVHKSYTCTICNMTFNNYQPYYNHKFKHYPNKMKFVCKYCNKRFINTTLLNVHMVVHTGKKNFQCELCMKRFSQRPHLQSHLLTHTGEKPHKCKFCTKSFAHLSTLVVHERIHTGETPYVCQFCNKGFGHLTNYKKHVFSQHGVVMPKTRDYSSFKKVPEDNDVESNDGDPEESVAEMPAEYIIINEEELIKSEVCEIICDDNNVLEEIEESLV